LNLQNENFGDSADEDDTSLGAPLLEKGVQQNGFKYILAGKDFEPLVQVPVNPEVDKRLWALCITSCFFEGTMYLWIFFKFPALKLSHEEKGMGSELPFGMIFAALMCSMMLGSMFFTYYSSLSSERRVVSPSTLLMLTLMVASACFVLPVITHHEAVTFWCFCVFEMCCGIYFPSMAHLKEKNIDDGVRAKIYGIMRVPLNAFVVIGLMLTKDGKWLLD
jgi:hypothetical protein